ncbi:uncharacterized protein ISCGN_024772 [Ixodes scapularis]
MTSSDWLSEPAESGRPTEPWTKGTDQRPQGPFTLSINKVYDDDDDAVQGVRNKTKALIIEAIKATGADADELAESLDLAKDRQREELEKRERSDRIRREELELELKRQQQEIELKKLDLELKKSPSDDGSGGGSGGGDRISFKMKNLMQPYKVGEDIGLFLVNFERTCEKLAFACNTWPQRLLTLLPCEAADVVARLSKEDAECYDVVKSNLLKRYRLSTEVFRLRFRQAKKGKDESYLEFAYDLKANLIEWLKSAEVFDNLESVVECFCLEQFYRSIPEQTRLWILDQREVKTTQRAAELAEEYAVRRNLREEDRYGSGRRDTEPKGYSRKGKCGERENLTKKAAPETQGNERRNRPNEEHQAIRESSGTKPEQKRAFEAKKPMVCLKCQKPGHIAAGCRSPNVVFSYISENEENRRLLEPYLSDLTVNGKACRVLRDSAATMDVIHPTYVDPNGYIGGCAWIRQVIEEHSVCLPVARVCLEGPFGTLHTEAAVSGSLPLHYPYIFSNKSDQMLREKGLSFSVPTRPSPPVPRQLVVWPFGDQKDEVSYTTDDLVFDWEEEVPLVVDDSIELPQHNLVSTEMGDCTQVYSTGNFTCIQLIFTLKRRLGYYMFHTYIPTCLIVIMSWISFWIKPEAVPARVTLCVTSLLTLSTQHAQSQKSLPPVSYIKAIDIFMSSCTVFVFASLMEYALVNILMGEAQTDDGNRRRSIRNVIVSARVSESSGVPNGTKPPRAPETIACECRQRAMLVDKVSRILFPASFILLNCIYWSLYITS